MTCRKAPVSGDRVAVQHTLGAGGEEALGVHMLALTALVSLSALELTPANFDKEVFDSGKSAFIKFLAPW